jgi:hypothetical protein
MKRVYSNGGARDYVLAPFERLMATAARLHLAAPYFTSAGPIVAAAGAGKTVQLLVGLNGATQPAALAAVLRAPNVAVRYLTYRFHAKIYLFDDAALLGSANLTDGGLQSNREAVICLDQAEDFEAIEEVRALFLELWESAPVLTPAVMSTFAAAWQASRPKGPDPDDAIEAAIGRAEPRNIAVTSATKSRERLFLDDLQRQIFEQYRPAFSEVSDLLAANGFRRPELAGIGLANETVRRRGEPIIDAQIPRSNSSEIQHAQAPLEPLQPTDCVLHHKPTTCKGCSARTAKQFQRNEVPRIGDS